MNQFSEKNVARGARLRNALIIFGALILIAAGVFLLIAPQRAQAGEVGDNVIANNYHVRN